MYIERDQTQRESGLIESSEYREVVGGEGLRERGAEGGKRAGKREKLGEKVL